KFIPDRFEKIFLQWIENLRDWNISRQIPWGIRIPVWHCEIKKAPIKKMGFHESVVSEVFDGKISTWRIRDHQLQAGDIVAFENSQAGELFGYGEIIQVTKTTVGQLDLKDKTHYKTYKNRRELIGAFKRHNPGQEINENTSVFAYTYKFKKIDAGDGGCGRTIVSSEKPKRCTNCGSGNLREDPEVFDTWFSSGQWPFATLQTTKKGDFEYFYPTTVMETAADILFFWVARMVMLGFYVTGKVPFKYVYLHGLVRDKDRQKMSKSKGNVMDPLGVVEMHGADALRMALVFANSPGQDIAFSEEKIIAQRRFANKIWNASRFVLQQASDSRKHIKIAPKTGVDKEILRELTETIKSTTKDIDNFQFHEAAQTLYQFFWHTFCDVYIEASKKQIEEGSLEEKENTKSILLYVLRESLKLLHPFMPFITEEIYQMLPNKEKDSLIIETWPK
ncbi:MAG: class I tRNA ligase family protein, partial [Candidatus Pacebacteria bacterium]|nr:class I tRNA ligase family protein [Candidatus Paceibacterota bacterium]